MHLLPGAADVVEAAQHAGDVAHGLVGQRALGQRAQRLTLEVEEHPAAVGGVQHLAQVVVAVDALQRGPRGRLGGTQHGIHGSAHLREPGRLGDRGLEAQPHLGDDRPGLLTGRRLGAEDVCEGAVHLGGRLAEGAGRAGEVGAGLGRVQRHAPGVLDAGEELLGEGEVAGCRDVAVGARVRPAGRSPRRRRPARAGEPASTRAPWRTTSGLSPGDSIRKTLTMRGVWWPSGRSQSRMTEVLDCSPDSTARGADVHLRAPAGLRHTGDRLLDGVRPRRRLRPHPALDELEQLGGVDGVVRCVVDPAAPERRVLHRAHEGVVGAAERLAAVGERHLVDDRLGAGLVGDEERLDADLALGVVEPPRREQAQPRAAALGGVPALVAHPPRDQLELRRGDRGRRGSQPRAPPRRGWSAARRSRASRASA